MHQGTLVVLGLAKNGVSTSLRGPNLVFKAHLIVWFGCCWLAVKIGPISNSDKYLRIMTGFKN